MPHHLGVSRRGHRDHVDQVALGAQPLQQPEPVPVGQVHVQQQQVDVAVGLEEPGRVAGRPGDPGELEAGDPTDVRRVRLGRELLVLDDEDADRSRRHRDSVGA